MVFFFAVEPRFIYLLTMCGQETTSRQIRDLEARLTAANERCAAAEALLLGTVMMVAMALSGVEPLHGDYVIRYSCTGCTEVPHAQKIWESFHFSFQYKLYQRRFPDFSACGTAGQFRIERCFSLKKMCSRVAALKPDRWYIRSPFLRTRPFLSRFSRSIAC
jgi:hypothetical protein